jgi:hypothetical protein
MVGFHALAQAMVHGKPAFSALVEGVRFVIDAPTLAILLLLPFLGLGWAAGSMVRPAGLSAAGTVFGAGLLLFGFLFLSSQMDAVALMKDRKWTAASIAIGSLPLKALLVLGLCLILRWLGLRKVRAHNEKHEI